MHLCFLHREPYKKRATDNCLSVALLILTLLLLIWSLVIWSLVLRS